MDRAELASFSWRPVRSLVTSRPVRLRREGLLLMVTVSLSTSKLVKLPWKLASSALLLISRVYAEVTFCRQTQNSADTCQVIMRTY